MKYYKKLGYTFNFLDTIVKSCCMKMYDLYDQVKCILIDIFVNINYKCIV